MSNRTNYLYYRFLQLDARLYLNGNKKMMSRYLYSKNTQRIDFDLPFMEYGQFLLKYGVFYDKRTGVKTTTPIS